MMEKELAKQKKENFRKFEKTLGRRTRSLSEEELCAFIRREQINLKMFLEEGCLKQEKRDKIEWLVNILNTND